MPVAPECRVEGGAVLEMYFEGTGTVRVPVPGLTGQVEVVTQGPTLGSRGTVVPSRVEEGVLVFDVKPGGANGWVYAVVK